MYFAFYRKHALYTLHFSNAYSCNYMYNVHVHLFSKYLTGFFTLDTFFRYASAISSKKYQLKKGKFSTGESPVLNFPFFNWLMRCALYDILPCHGDSPWHGKISYSAHQPIGEPC